MKLRTAILTTFICLLLLSTAFAEENRLEGYASLTGRITDINGNKAKFNEYRDIKSGVYPDIRLGYDTGNYFIDGSGHNIGFDNQNYHFDAGAWGKGKLFLDYNDIPHNITYGAKSFYSGTGTNNLTGAPNTNTGTWKTFDYSLRRKQYGGGLRLDTVKPFYLSAATAREERNGIKPAGASITTPGGPAIEIPEPINYRTNNLNVELGYATKPLFASVQYFYSDFDNENHFLSFEHPTALSTDNLTLPPDNQYYKIGFKGGIRLPMNTRFNVNLSTARAKSNANLLTSYIFEGTADTLTSLSSSVFNGKTDTDNYAFALTAHPLPFIDGKLIYNYYQRKNKSDEIETTDPLSSTTLNPVTFATVAGVPFTNDLFGYKRNTYGVEAGVRLPMRLTILPSYRYVDTHFDNRLDVEKTRDNIYAVDVRWSGPGFMTARAGYERLSRRIDHLVPSVDDNPVENIYEQYLRRFDIAPKDRDTFKIGADIYPLDALSVGIGYKYKKTDYKDASFGLQDDRRNEIDIDADYTFGKLLKLSAYYDYERIKLHQFQRNNPFNGTTLLAPTDTSNATNFNWVVTQKDESYNFGAGADIYVVPSVVTLRIRYDYMDSEGHADFSYLTAAALTGGRTNDNIDLDNLDDYQKSSLTAKVIYNVTKALSVSAGYAYERYRYSDAQLNNYQYTYASGGANYLTGAYSAPSYNANIIFATVAYKF